MPPAGRAGRRGLSKTCEKCLWNNQTAGKLLEDLGPLYFPKGPVRVGETWTRTYTEVVKTFGTRARVPVSGTINGFPFRSSLSPMGGQHVMCINKEMQAGAQVKTGDIARFVMQRDDKPRTVALPPALKKALAAKCCHDLCAALVVRRKRIASAVFSRHL